MTRHIFSPRSFPLALLLTGLMAAVSQAELLTNPGFEDGNLNSWKTDGTLGWYVNTWDQRTGTHAAVDNIEPADTTEWHVLDQYIAASPGQVFSASVWLKTVAITTTEGWLEVLYLDSTKAINWALGGHQSTHVSSDHAYQLLTLSNLTTPAGAAYIDVRGVVQRKSAPAGTNYFCFDDFSLELVPEPASIVLFVTGLIGLLAYAWRKRK